MKKVFFATAVASWVLCSPAFSSEINLATSVLQNGLLNAATVTNFVATDSVQFESIVPGTIIEVGGGLFEGMSLFAGSQFAATLIGDALNRSEIDFSIDINTDFGLDDDFGFDDDFDF